MPDHPPFPLDPSDDETSLSDYLADEISALDAQRHDDPGPSQVRPETPAEPREETRERDEEED